MKIFKFLGKGGGGTINRTMGPKTNRTISLTEGKGGGEGRETQTSYSVVDKASNKGKTSLVLTGGEWLKNKRPRRSEIPDLTSSGLSDLRNGKKIISH